MNENPPDKRKSLYLILITFILLLVLFILGLVPHLFNTNKIDNLAAENPLPRVNLLEIKPNTKPIELILPSSAQAWHYTPIWSRVNGYLKRFLVDIGDMVKEGDLLAEIDTPETDQQLEQAKADLLNSIAVRDIAKVTSERWNALWNKNREAVSKQEVDQFNANLESADANVIANEKNVERLTYQQQFKFIYAPFDGIITNRFIDIGSLVYGTQNGNTQELFQLAQEGIIRFFVDVPQTYYRQIHDGVEAEITIIQLPNHIFKGKVSRFAKSLDPIARTLLTQIDVVNTDRLLYPGLFGNVKFLLNQAEINFIIPTTAVIIRSGYPHVAVVDQNDIVHLKKVQIGRDYGNQMQIVDGLQPNDHIIVIPSAQIQEGIKVDIVSLKKDDDHATSPIDQ